MELQQGVIEQYKTVEECIQVVNTETSVDVEDLQSLSDDLNPKQQPHLHRKLIEKLKLVKQWLQSYTEISKVDTKVIKVNINDAEKLCDQGQDILKFAKITQ